MTKLENVAKNIAELKSYITKNGYNEINGNKKGRILKNITENDKFKKETYTHSDLTHQTG